MIKSPNYAFQSVSDKGKKRGKIEYVEFKSEKTEDNQLNKTGGKNGKKFYNPSFG